MERKKGSDEKHLHHLKTGKYVLDGLEKTIIENDRKACSQQHEVLSLHTGTKSINLSNRKHNKRRKADQGKRECAEQ